MLFSECSNRHTPQSAMAAPARQYQPGPLGQFNDAIRECGRRQEWCQALDLLGRMRSSGVTPSTITFNCLIVALGRSQQCGRALAVLALLIRTLELPVPDAVTWNSAIGACQHAVWWASALGLLRAMPASGVAPSPISFNMTISACGRARRWARALALLAEAHACGSAETLTVKEALVACKNGGGRWMHALALLGAAPAHGVALDDFCFAAAISTCEKAGAWAAALRLIARQLRMGSGAPQPDKVCFGAAIMAVARAGRWACALALADAACRVRAPLDRVGLNAVLMALERGARWRRAIALLRAMARGAHGENGRPDAFSCSTAVFACGARRLGREMAWETALAVLRGMGGEGGGAESASAGVGVGASAGAGAGIERTVACFNGAITACGGAGRWERALGLLAAMEAAGVRPNDASYGAAIAACARASPPQWERAIALLDDARAVLGAPPSAHMFRGAIDACSRGGQGDRAIALLDGMRGATRPPSSGPGSGGDGSGGDGGGGGGDGDGDGAGDGAGGVVPASPLDKFDEFAYIAALKVCGAACGAACGVACGVAWGSVLLRLCHTSQC